MILNLLNFLELKFEKFDKTGSGPEGDREAGLLLSVKTIEKTCNMLCFLFLCNLLLRGSCHSDIFTQLTRKVRHKKNRKCLSKSSLRVKSG